MSQNLLNQPMINLEKEVNTAQSRKKISIWIITGIIFIGMLAWGIGGFINNGKEYYVATIGSEVITEMHLETEMTKIQKNNYDKSLVPYIREIALQNIILGKILKQEAKTLNLDLSDKLIAQHIIKDKQFEGEAGFDKTKFNEFLNNGNLTEKEYIERIKQKIVTEVIIGIINLPKANLANLANYQLKSRNQKRIIDLFILPKQNNNTIEVSEQELSDFYLSHKNLFVQKANANIKYISSEDAVKKNFTIVSNKEVETEFNKIYGGKYSESRSIYMLTLTSQEDIDKALFLLKNRKKKFLEVAAIFDKKEKDILIDNISYFDLQPHVRDVVFSLPINKTSDSVQITSDRFAIIQVNKIFSTRQDITEKNKAMRIIYDNLLKQKNCEKIMMIRDQARDMIAMGKNIDEIASFLGIVATDKKIIQNSNDTFDKIIDNPELSEGYTDIIEGDCRFDLVVVEKMEKFRNKEFNEAYVDIIKALKQTKAEELSINMANDVKKQLEKLDTKNTSLLNNFAKGRNMKINTNFKILHNDKNIDYDLKDKVFNSKLNDIVGPILLKDGFYVVAILRRIENNDNYKKNEVDQLSSEIIKEKQSDMQDLYKKYLYDKYNVKIYKLNK